ncbi:DUF3857 and transglutaminase domain-containing protein [Winogradskyella sp.]|nr:DUF3857 and transglutaminase domain-containing protein [Winogradskyella sp.]
MIKRLLFLLAITLGLSQIEAQNYDFGKVSKSELQEKFHPKDSSASVAILYRKEEIVYNFNQNLGFVQERSVQVRIKIYTEDGFEWANKKVYLYRGNSSVKENVKGLKGYTFNIEGGKVKKDKLKGSAVFEEEISENYSAESFILPNVKVGSVLEYTYTVTSTSPIIDDVNLQFSVPTNKLDVKIATPLFYSFNRFLNPKAIFTASIKESTKQKNINTGTSSSATRSDNTTGGSFGSNSTDYVETIVSINEVDIPALTAESFSGNINNYKAKLSMELAAFVNANGVVTKSFTSTWDKVSKTIYESDNFGRQLDKSSFFKDDLNALTEGVEDDFQKAFIVENLVKSKVKWNGTYGKYVQKGIRTAYKEGEGNVGDINLLVTAMLRSQGVNANPVLVSTRNNGFPLFPTREGFNYVVCMVVSGDSYMLIDATELYSTNNVLPQRVLNWKGRLLNKDGSSRWVNLESNKKSTESAMLNITLNEDLSATGKVRQNITSYSALNYRKKYTNVSEEDHIKALEANKGDLVISELNFENDKDVVKPVRVSYSYELTDAVDDIGGNLYFTPMLFLGTKESPFKLTERNYPIDFVIPFEDKYLVNIALPEGYKVESLPETLAIEFKGGESKFVYIAKMNGKYLQLKVELEVNNPYVSPADYASFKAFFEKTVEKQAEQIVLIKA